MSIIFISGPMTGKPNFNRDEFNTTAARLWAIGHTVLNPATLPDSLTYGDYMEISLAMLRVADTIYLLDGWEESEGARRELDVARRLRLEISTPESRKRGAS
ncbi:DUF4406 domain-containing protein [Salmonella enterica]|nr:DUF4406 domain-containing protein [Salmonella enterica]